MFMINVKIVNSYSESKLAFKINIKFYNDVNDNFIYLNSKELINEIRAEINEEKCQILYFDERKESFVYLGLLPDDIIDKYIEVNPSSSLLLKFRKITPPSSRLKIDFTPNFQFLDSEKSSPPPQKVIGEKSKRAKERTISDVVKSVYMWRRMYNGCQDENGKFRKFSLEDAASYLGISKKSLDDYLIQIKTGRRLGFDFNRNQSEKIGVLRTFIKENRKKCK